MEKVNENAVSIKGTIKVSELKKGDKCIVKDRIYRINTFWLVPTLTKIGLFDKLKFVLYCDDNDDTTKIETIYHVSSVLVIDENGYVKMD
jgi:hypothetical protein